MTRPDPHELYEELAAGHALSALEPEDEQAFLVHVAACARCERELEEHRSALAHLAYAPEAAEPPPALLEGIRAGVLASGRGASFPQQTSPQQTSTEPPAPSSLEQARLRRQGQDGMRRAKRWTAVAAAASLVVGLGAWNLALRSDRDQQDAWNDRVTAAMRELGQEDTDSVPLKSGDDVVAVALVHGDEMSLLVDGLKANDRSSTTYVLWGQSRFGDVRPVGAFDVTEEGMDVREGMRLQAGVADVTRFMVTHEQGRTAPPIPRAPVLASGNV